MPCDESRTECPDYLSPPGEAGAKRWVRDRSVWRHSWAPDSKILRLARLAVGVEGRQTFTPSVQCHTGWSNLVEKVEREHVMRTTLAWILGLLAAINGLFMLLAPDSWYLIAPGVPDTGPFNQYFVRDIGTPSWSPESA